MSADYCFIGEAMAAHESVVLVMVDTRTSVVFAHVFQRNGADPDIVETLMEVGPQTDRVQERHRESSPRRFRESLQLADQR